MHARGKERENLNRVFSKVDKLKNCITNTGAITNLSKKGTISLSKQTWIVNKNSAIA